MAGGCPQNATGVRIIGTEKILSRTGNKKICHAEGTPSLSVLSGIAKLPTSGINRKNSG